jgi:hypothetical protein
MGVMATMGRGMVTAARGGAAQSDARMGKNFVLGERKPTGAPGTASRRRPATARAPAGRRHVSHQAAPNAQTAHMTHNTGIAATRTLGCRGDGGTLEQRDGLNTTTSPPRHCAGRVRQGCSARTGQGSGGGPSPPSPLRQRWGSRTQPTSSGTTEGPCSASTRYAAHAMCG